jgi:hypothetical protein
MVKQNNPVNNSNRANTTVNDHKRRPGCRKEVGYPSKGLKTLVYRVVLETIIPKILPVVKKQSHHQDLEIMVNNKMRVVYQDLKDWQVCSILKDKMHG